MNPCEECGKPGEMTSTDRVLCGRCDLNAALDEAGLGSPLGSPRYEHDCDVCTFLGQYFRYDLYFCPQSGDNPTVLARYGTHGDYESGLRFAKPEVSAPLYEAACRARDRGLL